MFLLNFVIYFLIPLAIGIFLYFKRKFSYFESRGIPHVKPRSPFGNLHGGGWKYHMSELVLKVYHECKGKDVISGFYNFAQPVFLIMDEELVKSILIKDFNNFVNRGLYCNEEGEPLSGHLFAIEDDRWRFVRNKLSPVFTSGKLKSMYPTIRDKGDKLVAAIDEKMKTNTSIEVKDITNRFTVDVISSVAFGMEANTLNYENDRLVNMFKELSEGGGFMIMKFLFASVWPNFAKSIGIKIMPKSITDFFVNVVGTNIKYREETNDNRSDFLNMLIQLKNKGSIDGEISTEKKKLTLNEIMAQAFLFHLAGSDTSSTAISFGLAELGRNQEIQDKLRQEIEEKTKDANGEFTYETIMEMTYLNQVVNETVRMYNPGIMSIRQAKEEYKIPNTNYTIPKGAPVWIPFIGFHFDERFFPNPNEFNPDRFTREEIEKRPSYVYLPFGEGPRNCIGMRFGLLNVKLGIASVIKNFKVTLDSKIAYPFKLNPKNTQLEVQGGVWMDFEKI